MLLLLLLLLLFYPITSLPLQRNSVTADPPSVLNTHLPTPPLPYSETDALPRIVDEDGNEYPIYVEYPNATSPTGYNDPQLLHTATHTDAVTAATGSAASDGRRLANQNVYFQLTDTYGDGWNGNKLAGAASNMAMNSGSGPVYHVQSLIVGGSYTMRVYNPGGGRWAYECRWTARLDSHTGFAIAKGNEGSYSSPGAAAYQFTFTLCSTGQFYIINSGSYFGSSCHSCPAGKYQATSTSCAVCASGKYQTAAAQSSCTACAKGRYQSDNAVNAANHDAASDCIVCAAGKYAGATSTSSCTDCGKGTYLTNNGIEELHDDETKCTACETGKYGDTLGRSSNCANCPSGKYNSQVERQSSGDCMGCGAGTYSTSGASACANCAAGKYSNTASATSSSTCSNCGAGQFSTAGSSSCESCAAGKYGGAGGCNDCLAGSYSTGGTPACTVCPRGKYLTSTGATSESACLHCPAGTYLPNFGSLNWHNALTDCTDCASGKFSTTTAATSLTACSNCAAGSYSTAGSQTCGLCPAGRFSGTPGLASSGTPCEQCPARYWSGSGYTACEVCEAGKSSDPGSTSPAQCSTCAAGTYMNSVQICTTCPSGKYNDRGDLAIVTCFDCPKGTYLDAADAASHDDPEDCVSCERGKFASAAGSSACTNCYAGTFAPSGSSAFVAASQCTTCEAGKYAYSGYVLECIGCGAGKYNDDAGISTAAHNDAADCSDCAAGKFTATTASTSCYSCDVGTIQTSTGGSSCNSCPPGRYNSVAASFTSAPFHDSSDDCSICPAGQYNTASGATACTDCPAGKFIADDASADSNHNSLGDCTSCAAGKYASSGASTCTSCVPGTYLSSAGTIASDCVACEKGKFSASAAAASCATCAKGLYSSTTASTECQRCMAGRYLSDDATTPSSHDRVSKCLACAPGTKNAALGQSSCESCSPGSTSSLAALACDTCDVGKYASALASSSCTPCGAGSFSSSGAHECTSCAAGYYTGAVGQTACLQCAVGRYSASTGASACAQCAAGKASGSGIGATGCSECDAGFFALSGATTCSFCAVNHFSSGTGNSACTPCPTGQNAPEGSAACSTCAGVITAAGCVVCMPGEYASAIECASCNAGTRSSGGASTTCQVCAAGKFSANPDGSSCDSACTLCTECSAGTFSPDGSKQCISCSAGKISAPGAFSCHSCYAGSYSSTGSSICSQCSPGKFSSHGSSLCSPCSGGTYSLSSAPSCIGCAAGRYSASSSSSCADCETGTFAGSTGMGSCVMCSGGKFAAYTGLSICADCAKGTYSSSSASSCTNCAAGKTSENAAYMCDDCAAGTYSSSGDASCALCAAGTYSNFPGATACLSCSPGFFCYTGSNSPQQNECGAANVYCPLASAAATAVDTGFYSSPLIAAGTLRESQTMCEDGYYCDATGVRMTMLSWENCAASMNMDESRDASSASPAAIFTPSIVKNALITDANIAVASSLFTIVSIVDLPPPEDEPTPSSPLPTCMSASGLFIDPANNALVYSAPFDYSNCRNGVRLTLAATITLESACADSTAPAAPSCITQTPPQCVMELRIKNKNDAPVWNDPQAEDVEGDCYTPSSMRIYEVAERSEEFTKFGPLLETCTSEFDPGDSVLFSIVETPGASNDGFDLFDISSCGGQLLVKEGAQLRYVMGEANQYKVAVVATDMQGASNQVEIQVHLINVNDVPYFNDDFPSAFSVDENSDAGTQLAPAAVYVTDLDNDNLLYSLLSNEDDMFIIVPETGDLYLAKTPNFEDKRSYTINIEVTDSHPDTIPVTSGLVVVNIVNKNDAPVFQSTEEVEFIFPELTTTLTDGGPTYVGDVTTLGSDEDVTDFVSDGSLLYKLYSSWDPSANTGALSTDFGVKVIRDTSVSPFDFENNDDNVFELLLVLQDDEATPAHVAAPLPVTIKLSNVNEPPVFGDFDDKEILESSCAASNFIIDDVSVQPAAAPAIVATVSASDPDSNQETFLRILTAGTPFTVSESRQISETETEWDIVLNMAVDYETTAGNTNPHQYDIELQVSDGQENDQKTLIVAVLNCNEAPVITYDSEIRSVDENSVAAVSGNAIVSADADLTDGKTYAVVGGSGRHFFSISNTGELSSTKELDFEETSSYTVQIEVTDDPSLTASSHGDAATSHALTFTVGVTNVNENPTMKEQSFIVTESLKPSDVIGQATVEDPEFTESALSSDTATVLVTDHTYKVDSLTPEGSACPGDTSSVGQCCEVVFELFHVAAAEGALNQFEVRALDSFPVDQPKPLNNLGGCNFTFSVAATDGGWANNPNGGATTPLSSEAVVFTVQVKGTNNAPSIENQKVLDIPENSAYGDVIVPGGTLQATDEDTEDELAWFIVTTLPLASQPFAIDSTNGEISVTEAGMAMLDFETSPAINITVGVRDDGPATDWAEGVNAMDVMTPDERATGSALFDTAVILLKLKNMPETPEFTARQPTFKLSETESDCTLIGVDLPGYITATDEDAADEGNIAFTVHLTNNPDMDSALPFGIRDVFDAALNQNKGQLFLKQCTGYDSGVSPLNFEAVSDYKITVTVTDTAGKSATIETEVVIEDGNEPPAWKHDSTANWNTFSLAEDTGGGVYVGDMGVADPDSDPYVYEIVTGDASISELFRIDETGKLYTQAGVSLDYESKTSYEFSVKATETTTSELFFVTSVVNIAITDVNDMIITNIHPTVFDTAGAEIVTMSGVEFGPVDAEKSSKTVVTATYAGPDGVIYTAKGCTITQANTEIQCTTVAGIGFSQAWNVTVAPEDSIAWTATPSQTTSYRAPTITAVQNSELMPTSGLSPSLVTITGENFGIDYRECLKKCAVGVERACANICEPVGLNCEDAPTIACDEYPDWFISDAAYVTYGSSESDVERYHCSDAKVTEGSAGTEITCLSSSGSGKNFYWQVRIGAKDARATYIQPSDAQMSNVIHSPGSSYKAPSISVTALQAGVSKLPNNANDDSTPIVVSGSDFGNANDQLTLTYGNPHHAKYLAVNCRVTTPHVEVTCDSIPGVGINMQAQLTTNALLSNVFNSGLKYAIPVIQPLSEGGNAVQGQGSSMANTRGGEEIMIFGMNFGPVGDDHFPDMTYGPIDAPTLYTATNCYVKNSFNKITCTSAPGTGLGHAVQISVGAQLSNIYDAEVDYKPPSVHYFAPEWEGLTPPRDGGMTQGMEKVIIHGDNFGPASANKLDSVSYGVKGSEYKPCARGTAGTGGCACVIIADHTAIECFTTEGTGKTHKWSITIDGQNSTVSTTKYSRPEITTVEGMVDANPSGGEDIVITGKNFGNDQSKLQQVRYGPSGNEYLAVGCVVDAHTTIRCKTAEGVGKNLRWVVEVDSQSSDLSDVTTNYAAPELIEIIPANGVTRGWTEGGELHKIRGRNFAVLVQGAFAQIMFDGVPIVLDNVDLTKAVTGGSFTGKDSSEDGTDSDYFVFKLPEMKVLHQVKEVKILVGHTQKQNVEQTSGVMDFVYDSPFIDTIENIEGALAGAALDLATTDLIINGANFGRDEYASIYVAPCDDASPMVCGEEVQQEVWTWGHNKVSLNYLGLRGSVRVKVGDIWSNSMNFSDSSPELLYVKEYLPKEDGYDTTGYHVDGLEGSNDLTIAGCFFQHQVKNLAITIDGVDCEIYQDSLSSDIAAVEGFCTTDTLRKVTCMIPEGTGEFNEVILYRSSNPNYSGNNTVTLMYRPPAIAAFDPIQVDTSGADVTVTGTNFGNDESKVKMWMGDDELVIVDGAFTHQSITVKIPSGEGRPKPIRMVVDGQTTVVSKDDDKVVRYFVPVIGAVTPNVIATTGGTIEVDGQYFGREGKAEAYLQGADWIDVDVTGGEHTSLSISVGEGQGQHVLALNVSGNVETSALKFFPPMIGSNEDRNADDDVEVNTDGSGEIVLVGSNFGIGEDFEIKIEDLNDKSGDPAGVSYNSGFPVTFVKGEAGVKEFGHGKIVLEAPAGQNERTSPLTLSLTVAGQKSNLVNFDFDAPVISHLAMCFPDATAQVYQHSCVTEMEVLMSDCDRNGAGGCGLETGGGYTLAIMGSNFGEPGSGSQQVFFGGQELTKSGSKDLDVMFVSHNQINIRVPPGVGENIEIRLKVGMRETNLVLFSYDPPFIEDVAPARPDAEGDYITIHGVNFAPTMDLAGEINIWIGQTVYPNKWWNLEEENEAAEDGVVYESWGNTTEWLKCSKPKFGDVEFPIWQQKGSSSPYLWCQIPRVTVGPKHIRLSVAGQNVTVGKSAELVRPFCSEGFYGQEENSVYEGPIPGMCKEYSNLLQEQCGSVWDEDLRIMTPDEFGNREKCMDIKHSEQFTEMDGNVVNCTVLTRQNEYCTKCPAGSTCSLNTQFAEEPVGLEGMWRHEFPSNEESCGEDFLDREHRSHCYSLVPCGPPEACAGDNVCSFGYTGLKCDFCCDAMHRFILDDYGREIVNPECVQDDGGPIKYFRQYGECAPCPSNPWMIVAILLGGGTFMGSMAYVMKKKRISLGIISIAIDYFQILSLLSSTKTPWPQVILDLYTWLSAFNFNINITAPECVFEVAYDDKWKMIMSMPLVLFGLVFVYNWSLVFWKKCVKNKSGRKVHSHSSKSIGAATAIMYYVYMNLSMTALEVFNCGVQELEDPLTGELVSDGKQYMSETNWVCYEPGGDHAKLVPLAIICIIVYTCGYPCYMAYVLLSPKNRDMAISDQVLRAMDKGNKKFESPSLEHFEFRQRYYKLYYYYKPDKWYWMLVVLGRKFSVAVIALMFRGNATFQMCMIVLTIFISSNIQVRAQPFMSMSERAGVLLQHRDLVGILQEQMDNNKGKKKIRAHKSMDSLVEESQAHVSVASYFWNYNTVEMILLACAILVNVFGIMFESNYLKENSGPYETLANLTLAVLVCSLVYLFMVIWSEIVAAVFPGLECGFARRFADEDPDEDAEEEAEQEEGTAGKRGGLARQLSSKKSFGLSRGKSNVGVLSKQSSHKKKKTVDMTEQEMEMEMANMEFSHNDAALASKRAGDELNLSDKDMEKLIKSSSLYQDAMTNTKNLASELRTAKKDEVGGRANEVAEKGAKTEKKKKVFGFQVERASEVAATRVGGTMGGALKSGKYISQKSSASDYNMEDIEQEMDTGRSRGLTFEQEFETGEMSSSDDEPPRNVSQNPMVARGLSKGVSGGDDRARTQSTAERMKNSGFKGERGLGKQGSSGIGGRGRGRGSRGMGDESRSFGSSAI